MKMHAWPRDSHAETHIEWRYPCKDMHGHALSGDIHAKTCMDMHNHAKTCMAWR
jgi:hypothetical protein